ncbi:E3 ubiquitin-protein ligase MIB2-like isoform X1 [Leptotrombidium deliense]|uniref:Alpha-latrotoxin n=1 Tax=Leptotrombidium deliense TaxID=299467 RepID=A0A443S1G1_9ACAR|nr:E3 ubiquitin-protein ligase MIB2-like isoform X1 [Leptotrombidium deliense]
MNVKQQLFKYCATGNYKQLRRLINENVNLNVRDEKGNSCVHYASKSNNVNVLQLLIVNGADLNGKNDAGLSPLHQAVTSGAESCVSLLLKKGVRVNQFTNKGVTELMIAVQMKGLCEFSIIKQLVNHEEINLRAISSDRQRQTALHYAAFSGNAFAVKIILEKDASLHEIQNEFKNLPIHLAVSSRFNDVIRAIHGAIPNLNLNAKGHKLLTPLQMAVKFGNFSTIELLVHLKADCNVFDTDANSVLHIAVQGFNDCCHGRKKNNCGQKGNDSKDFKRVREYLSATQHINCAYFAVLYLLVEKCNANIYAKNNQNQTPLDLISHDTRVMNMMRAAYHSNEEIKNKQSMLKSDDYSLDFELSDEDLFRSKSIEDLTSEANSVKSFAHESVKLKAEVQNLNERVKELEIIVKKLQIEIKQFNDKGSSRISQNITKKYLAMCCQCSKRAEYSLLCSHKLCENCYEENNCQCIICKEI